MILMASAKERVRKPTEGFVLDAAYLEPAIRRGLPLATNDGKLRTAAEAAGVALLEVS